MVFWCVKIQIHYDGRCTVNACNHYSSKKSAEERLRIETLSQYCFLFGGIPDVEMTNEKMMDKIYERIEKRENECMKDLPSDYDFFLSMQEMIFLD